MNKKLRFREKQDHETVHHQIQRSESVNSFDSVEALIRHDAGETPVPETVRRRLQGSIAAEPRSRVWWRYLFGRRR